MAQIIAHLDGTYVAVDVLGDAPQNPGFSVVQRADNIKEIINWIEDPTDSPAVLIPSNLFGPDVMARCRSYPLNSTVPRKVFLMGQLKSYTIGNKSTLSAATMSHSLTSLHPDHCISKPTFSL